MKLSSIMCASLLALMLCVPSAAPVAATKCNDKALNKCCIFGNYVCNQARTRGDEQACTASGGEVLTETDGSKVCLPKNAGQPAESTTVKGSKSNSSDKTGTTQPAPAPATAPAPGSPQ